ncbi:MAG: hypothetical protein EF813_10445 [Methanosarcinales archaeon]|nr:MAG: hypothetical protein EF813_10445 [Methanosarcinales archaeon]
MSREGTCRMFSDNTAISTVVSFILIIGLLVTVIAFVKVQYVPLWTEDAEARHAREVFIDFSAIPGNIDNLVLANGSITMSQQRIKLGSSGTPIVAPGMSYGTLGIVPEDGSFTVTAAVRNVDISRNTTAGNLTKGCVNITNVSSVSSFYIYIGVFKHNGESLSDGSLYIDIMHQGNRSGRAEITTTNDTHLNISVRNSDNFNVIDDLHINADGSDILNYTIDLLNPRYGFCKVLGDADVPYNLTITNSTSLNGSHIYYIISYNEYNRTMEQYTKTTNGTIIYESMNRHFINQQFIYQNGAVFLCQPPSVSMRVAPGITIDNVKNYTRVMIPMVSLGTGRYRTTMISGSGVEELQLELNHTNRSSFADFNNTDNVSIRIEPPEGTPEFRNNYLHEWADYFDAAVNGTRVDAKPVPGDNNSSITITLTGNIHLEIRDLDVEGRISNII